MIALFLQIFTCFLFTTTTLASSPHGFTIDLIHRRSNSSSSRLSRTQLGSPYADVIFDDVTYLMKLQIGTPPFDIEAEIDTGSDLIWTQCLPCLNCYDQLAPIFDPSKSSTFKEVKKCHTHDHSCPYTIVYADNGYSKGTIATETVTIHSTSGEPFVMENTIIGCGHNNSQLSQSSSGLVGLDWRPNSFISQMGERFLGLVSYCFAGQGTSKINFGSNAIVAGDGTVATTMFKKNEKPGFYYLNLEAISVGNTRIETLGTPFHSLNGNMLIDSGTTYTYLTGSYCNQVQEAVDGFVTADRVADPSDYNRVCYNTDTIEIFPVITMHFMDGADLVLDKYNIYAESVTSGIFCVTIVCDDDGSTQDATFGNRAQNNFMVGYDTSSLLVSFKPTDCSALWS
ncbi:Aspartic proteinase CDR1 [Cardamine amara subsp. amara]|uniref:Aspartic proteinase CDR1 n=1 Tax=Cardamine amara subsp. amara TaxID=228776 RepID=A0ABD1B642_CARAN